MTQTRFSTRFAALLCFALPLAQPAGATSGQLDSAFVTGIGAGLTPQSYPTFDGGTGAVNAVALQSTGKILAGGNISKYNNTGSLNALKRINADGSLDASWNAAGAGLGDTQGQPEINILRVIAGDKVYAGGVFQSYNSTARSGVMRLNADGTLDTSFAVTGITNTNAFGLRYVLDIQEQSDGKVLVAGGFNRANGTFRPNLARFNADGSLDTTFDPIAALSGSSAVQDLALLPNGQILAAGGMNRPGGGSTPMVVRLNPNGSLDASFSVAWQDDYGDVDEILLLPDGRILVGGNLTSLGGTTSTLTCLNADGTPNFAFRNNLGTGPNGWAGGELALQPDGSILVGGIFTSFNGAPRASIARLSPDGVLDPAFDPPPYLPTTGVGYVTHLYSFAVQPDGKIVAGGWFSHISDIAVDTYNLTRFLNEYNPVSPGTLRLTSTAVTTTENAGGIQLVVSRFGGLAGAVSVNFSTAAGTAVAGTDFTATTGTLSWAAGEGGYKYITVPILQDTAQDNSRNFSVTLSGITGGATLAAAGTVATVTILDDDLAPVIVQQPSAASVEQGAGFTLSVRYDSVLAATVKWQRDSGTGFTDIPGATGLNYFVANADPATHAGSYRAIVTNANGSATSNAVTVGISVPAGSVVLSFNPLLTNPLIGAALDSSNRIVAIGNTTLLRIGADGVLDPTLTHTFNVSTSSVLVLPDGRIIVGGFFTQVDGQPRSFLVRINTNGTVDTAYNPVLAQAVQTMAMGTGGKYYVGMGSGAGLQRYNSDGTLDAGFTATGVGTGFPNGYIWSIRELGDGKILVGHQFQSGPNNYRFNRLNADGTLDATFTSPALNWDIKAIDVLPDGRIAVAGRFSSIAGVAQQRVAILKADGSLDTTFNFTTGADAPVTGIKYLNGRLMVWGDFQNIAGVAQRGLARLNLDGSLDTTFSIGAGASDSVNAAFLMPSGDVFIGGNFTTFKGVARTRAALLVGGASIGAGGFFPPRIDAVEDDAPLTLTLRRFGPITEAVSLSYTTADGTAHAGTDYTATSGTVSWVANDGADKTITVNLLDNTAVEAARTFRVNLSNPGGPFSAAAGATISLLDDDTPASITTQPSGGSLIAGGALTLTAVATSPSGFTYQWYLNGQPIPGATAATYSVPSLAVTQGGVYFVKVTNAAGSVVSAPANVIVRAQPGRIAPGLAANRPSLTGGPPRAIAPDATGGAFVGGWFPQVNGAATFRYLVRIKADGSLDSNWNPAPNNSVNALLLQPDGKLVVGGSFNQIAGQPAPRLARFNADGTLDTAFTAALGTGPGDSVNAIARLNDGRLVIGGNFTNLSGTGYIALLQSTGAVDPSFVSACNGLVTEIAIQNDGKILAAGGFTNYSGGYKFVRLELTGARDSTFTNAIGTGAIAGFNDLAVLRDGRILAGGYNFSNASTLAEASSTGGFATNLASSLQVYDIAQQSNGRILAVRTGTSGQGRVFRLLGNNPFGPGGNGEADTSFSTGTGPDADPSVIAAGPDGYLWLGGEFANFDGTQARGIIKLNGDPQDPAILHQPAAFGAAPGETAYLGVGAFGTGLAYQWYKGGVALTEGGRFTGVASAVLTISGVTAADEADYTVKVTGGTPATTVTSSVAHLHVLGSPVIAASPSGAAIYAGANLTLSAQTFALPPVAYVWKRDGQTILDGGRFSGASTASLTITGADPADTGSYTLTVINGTGLATTVPAFVLVSPPPASRAPVFAGLSATSSIRAFLPLPDGRMLVAADGATMNGANGTSALNTRLSLVNADGTMVPAPVLDVFNTNNTIHALVRQPDGKILLSGNFTGVNSVPRNRIARLNADFTLDAGFNPGTGASIAVDTLALDADGRIYAGGSFTSYDGQTQTAGGPSRNYLVRLNPNGSFDASFTSLNLSAPVNKVLSLPGGGVLVGGSFTSPQPYLMRLDATGASVAGFTPGPASVVNDLALTPSGTHFYAAFENAPSLARYTLAGAADTGFSLYASFIGACRRVIVQENGRLIGFGTFNQPVPNLVRLNADGSLDTSFANHGLSSTMHALTLDAAGRVWLGGTFTANYDSVPASRILVLNGDPVSLGFARHPSAQSVEAGATAQFSADVVATSAVTWQWFKNGAPLADDGRITGTRTRTLIINSATMADEGLFTVSATNTAGTRTSSPGELILLASPEIVKAPALVTVEEGASATFTVTARGAGTLSYQWLRNNVLITDGGDITGATTASLTLSNLRLTDAAYFSVRITNSLGTITTPFALLTVFRAAGAPDLTVTLPLFNGTVNGLIPLPDSKFVAAGNFSFITPPGTFGASRSRLARINADGSIDTTFPTANAEVTAILRDAAGGFIVGGAFSTLTGGTGNVNRNSLARIKADGSIDAAFTSLFTASAGINALAIDSTGGLLVAGSFTNAGGVNGASYLVRLNASTGAHDAAFNPGLTATVTALAVLPNGKVLAGGSTSGSRLKLLNADGTPDASLNYAGNLNIAAIQPLASGDILLGGTNSPYLQKVSAAGAALTLGGLGSGPGGQVTEILATSDDKFILGGQFSNYNNVITGRIARVLGDGSLDTTFNTGAGFGSTVNCLTFDATGRIWAGGSFTTYRSTNVGRVVVINPTDFTPPPPPPPGGDPFIEFLTTAGVPENSRGAGDDPDKDGLTNLMEYALDLNPMAATASGLPVMGATQTHLTLTYRRFRANVTYTVQASPDTSSAPAWSATGVDQGVPSANGTTTASIPIDDARQFLRLRVTLNP
ncbi:MAG TPA: immunoglobulin domain-containing protein [Verrucomicrobiales bacterium]|nr:immunoglobulin domain-containing protein [Verrucomicrobiales bacterium]